jgi:hypothetical protein
MAAIRKLAGEKLPPSLSAETLRSLARDMLGKELLGTVKPADCGAINEGAELLAPLPPENLGRLIGLGMTLGGKGEGKGTGMPHICPAPPR